eukprot:760499-Hanusia_phi.AAC.10
MKEWRQCKNFIEDFSVTTNGMGPPEKALAAAKAAVATIDHYPPANFEPHISHLAEFLWGEEAELYKNCLQLGNGASELIDLVIRSCAVVGAWRPGPTMAQYEEYKRSSEAAGFYRVAANDNSANLLCMVNPTNPSGDYMRIEELKAYIENNCKPGSVVIVDESMQPWVGPHWREDSLVSQGKWRKAMSVEKGVEVFVMHSWTKIWACTGVRLGSVIAPTAAHMEMIKAKQVPWSVNCIALAFLSAAVKDEEYLEYAISFSSATALTCCANRNTWRNTALWRKNVVKELNKYFPAWQCIGRFELRLTLLPDDSPRRTLPFLGVDRYRRRACCCQGSGSRQAGLY